MIKIDQSSCTDTTSYVTKHADFDFVVKPDEKIIQGAVTYTFDILKPVKIIKLDLRDIQIQECLIGKEKLVSSIKSWGSDDLGKCLEISLNNEVKEGQIKMLIRFATSPCSSALQWLSKNMTKMKKFPFFFSQCQAIHARSLVPCQDTPQVKFSFDASVEAPSELNILMGGINIKKQKKESSTITFFKQEVPIPAYLLSIAGGLIVGKKIGPRSTVWAEPMFLDACAQEFSGTCEKFIEDAEFFCGPYEWKIYDILVLPPTFPYGGMENPCLTFVTPTVVTGDKSNVNVIAHEIAHSWTGNLVTNCDWANFWLNEGHTVYLERLIIERVFGPEERNLHINIGIEELRESIEQFGSDHEFTKLVPTLNKAHPDDAYSRVPYEKGSLLLYNLEKILGKEKMFDWLKAYVIKFRNQSLDTQTWLLFFKSFHGEEKLKDFNFDKWFYATGMPDTSNIEVGDSVKNCRQYATLICSPEFFTDSEKQKEFANWLSKVEPKSVEYMLRQASLIKTSEDQLKLIDSLGRFTEAKNARLQFGFAKFCLLNKAECYIKFAIDFLNSQGVLKYSRPLYRLFNDWKEKRIIAVENYNSHVNEMHPVFAELVKKDLEL